MYVLSHVWLFATSWTVALQASFVHGIFQAILEWFAISTSRGSLGLRDRNSISSVSCIVKGILDHSKQHLLCSCIVKGILDHCTTWGYILETEYSTSRGFLLLLSWAVILMPKWALGSFTQFSYQESCLMLFPFRFWNCCLLLHSKPEVYLSVFLDLRCNYWRESSQTFTSAWCYIVSHPEVFIEIVRTFSSNTFPHSFTIVHRRVVMEIDCVDA